MREYVIACFGRDIHELFLLFEKCLYVLREKEYGEKGMGRGSGPWKI